MNLKKLIILALPFALLPGCSDDAALTFTAPSLDTPGTVFVGKSTGRETIDAVYSTGSADLTIKVDGVDVNMVTEGSKTLYGFGDAAGTTRTIRNAPIVTDELGIHAMRSLVFVTSGEEHTSAESYFYVRDTRGGINLIGGSSLSNFENVTQSSNLNITISILPKEINQGDSWLSLVPYSPFVDNGASLLFPTLVSTDATAPFSGETGCYLFWYRDHFFFGGNYFARSAYVYHKPGVGPIEFVNSTEQDGSGNIIATEGSSIAKQQSGTNIINGVSNADVVRFEQAIADSASTATNKFNNVTKIDASDISNPTGFDWIDIIMPGSNTPAPGQRGYAVHLAYPAVGYNVNLNTLTGPNYSGAFSPILEIDVDNDGIYDYVADNTSDLNIRTERSVGPFAANEPRNLSPVFISGTVRNSTNAGETLTLPIDSTPRNSRDVYIHINAFNDVVNNGAPHLYITGLADNSLPDMDIGKRIPVRVAIENITDKISSFNILQYELVWATSEAGVTARENVLNYLDTEFVSLGVTQAKPHIPAQSVAGTIYFQLILKTDATPPAGDNLEVLDITTPVYSVDIIDKTGITGTAPTPQVFVSPTSGSAPLKIDLYYGGSTDSDGLIDTVITDFGDGSTNEDSINGGSYTYSHDGVYPLTFYFVDNDGLTSSYTQTITVSSIGSLKLINQHQVAITELLFSEISDLEFGNDKLAGSLLPSTSTSFTKILAGQYDYRITLSDGRSFESRFTISGGQEAVLEVSKFLIP